MLRLRNWIAAGVLALGLASGMTAAAQTPDARNWRQVDLENTLYIDTVHGRMVLELYPEIAPRHVERIKTLTRAGFYDGLTFHRVIDDFMAQTGDPLGTGDGQSPFPDLAAEFTFRRGPEMDFVAVSAPQGQQYGFIGSLPVATQPDAMMGRTADGRVHGWGVYCPGVAGMARGEEPNSANSQFFLMRDRYPKLEKRYTAFGRALVGQDVINAIKVGEPVADPQDRMERVRVLSALPENERPKIRVIDPAGPWFKAEIARARAAQGSNFSACDVNIPVEVK